jgi:hypothetical protein
VPDRGTSFSYVSMHTVKKTNRAYHVPNSTRTGMEDRVDEQASLLLIDSQIEELEQRLNALQEVIVAMTAAGGDVREQAELMLKMLRMRRALAIFRTELKDGAMAQYGNGETL